MKFDKANQEKIKFVEKFALELVAYVYNNKDFLDSLISDESKLSDFSIFSPEKASRVENDIYYFTFYKYDHKKAKELYNKTFLDLNIKERESIKIKKETFYHKNELIFQEDILKKIKLRYKVILKKEDLNLNLYELAYKIKLGQNN